NFVFLGSGTAPDTRGMRLQVVVGGVGVPFLNGNGTIGRLGQAGRELQLDEVNAASHLKVTRKVFVPRDGYFARYLEALENTTDDRESIVNFRVPAEGTNTVEPLPTVSAGVIQGKVLSGDGVTPIPFAPVHFQSRSTLFGRVFNVSADASGAFEFRARTDGSY